MIRAFDSLLEQRGSTRPMSLLRILIAVLVAVELGSVFRLTRSIFPPYQLGLSFAFWTLLPLFLLGVWSRWSAAAMGAMLMTTVVLCGHFSGDGTFLTHHVYTLTITCVWLSFTPCGGSFSVDRIRAVRAAHRAGVPVPEEQGDLWGVTLIKLQVVAIYWWSGYNKSHLTFPAQFEHRVRLYFHGAEPVGPLVDALLLAAGAGAVVAEWLLPLALLYRPTRATAIAVGVVFHMLIYTMFSVATFSATMVCLYLAFVDPRTIHGWVDELFGGAPAHAATQRFRDRRG